MSSPTPFITSLLDEIINKVNQEFPNNGEARIGVYADLGERFTGLARAFSQSESFIDSEEPGPNLVQDDDTEVNDG